MNILDKHSFAILAYNQSPYLEVCIKSIINQSVSSLIYVATSTPSEFINEIVKKYDLKLFVNKQSNGIVDDWNFAVDMCETPFLTLAHQDDIYYPEYSKNMVSVMEEAKDGIIAFCDYNEKIHNLRRSNSRNLIIKRLLLWPFLFKYKIKSRFFKRLILRFGSPICCPSVLYNISLRKPLFNDSYSCNMDWDTWLRFCDAKGSIIYVKRKLMEHRIHENSTTTFQIENMGRYQEDLKMFKRLWPEPIAKLIAKLYSKSYSSNKI